MKHLLFATAVILASTAASALNPSTITTSVEHIVVPTPLKADTALRSPLKSLKRPALNLPGKSISVEKQGSKAVRHLADGGFFYESFEQDALPGAWNEKTSDTSWLPEGWSRISHSEISDEYRQIYPDEPISWYAYPLGIKVGVPCADGNYAMGILYCDEYKDEWLVTPEIAISEGQNLTFSWYISKFVWFWVVNSKHVDYENGVFTNRETAATLKVMASVDGGEWVEIKDLSDDYLDKEFAELFDDDNINTEMIETSLPLDEFAGKNVRLAFRYVGTDGDSMYIDGVSINNGVAELNALYMPPLTSMYAGLTVDMVGLEEGVQVHPTNTQLYWFNMSENEIDPVFSWSYDSELPVIDSDADYIAVEFPTPACADSQPFDIYWAPALTAEAEGSRPATFEQNVCLMAGGKVEVEELNVGLLPFDPFNDGMAEYAVAHEDFNEYATPIFGYDKNVDDFWRLYTAGGSEENLPDIPYAHVTAIINAFFVSDAPLVVNGAWLYALGKISDDARFTCSIHLLKEDGEILPAVASATVNGNDVLRPDSYLNFDYLSLPFKFDKPAVLDASGTEGELFVVLVSGFHDGGVEYFSPLMQIKPNPYELATSFYRIEYANVEYNSKGEAIVVDNIGLSHVANHYNKYGEMYCNFAICLDAEYPWLECEADELVVGDEPVTLALNSFYPASDLKISLADGSDLPEGLKVRGEGRLSEASLAVDATNYDGEGCEILISAPGVARKVSLKKMSGIDAVEIPTAHPASREYFDLMGHRVVPSARGVYFIRETDGTVTKSLR